MGVDDVADVFGRQLELGQLGDDFLTRLGAGHKDFGNRAQPTQRVMNRLAVDAGVKHHVALGMGDEVGRDGDGELFACVQVRKKQLAVEL